MRGDRLLQRAEGSKGLRRRLRSFHSAINVHIGNFRARAQSTLEFCKHRLGNRHALGLADKQDAPALTFRLQAIVGQTCFQKLEVAVMRATDVPQPFRIADFEDTADRGFRRSGRTTFHAQSATSCSRTRSPVSELIVAPLTFTSTI